VGRAIAASVADPFERVKAVHDYVADRIAYDVPSYLSRNIPSQEADTVFHARRGVCSGYAKLMVAIGTAAGIETKYIVGSSRDMGGDVSGQGHAWNAVRVGQRWFLLDATWDAGSVSGSGFNKGYRSDYLLTPPGIFGANHLPDDPAWQLRAKPISHAEFIRQPNLRPSFHAMGLRMQHPTRSQVSVEEPFVAEVENPQGRFMTASYEDKYAPFDERCTVTDGPVIRVQCDMRPGTYHVKLFANEERFGVFDYVGQFEVNRR
jgi:transglutaminase/protease-like cytokinesis protein 3